MGIRFQLEMEGKNMIEASLTRRDGKADRFRNVYKLVHSSCRKLFVAKRDLKKFEQPVGYMVNSILLKIVLFAVATFSIQ